MARIAPADGKREPGTGDTESDDQFGLMLRSPLSLSFETAFGLLRMRLKGRLEACGPN